MQKLRFLRLLVPSVLLFAGLASAQFNSSIEGADDDGHAANQHRGQQGNLGRNTFEGPGLANVNLNVNKSARVPWFFGSEGATVELRGEIFNMFNGVNLTQPSSDLASGLFGRSTDQSLPRAVQLGIRIQF